MSMFCFYFVFFIVFNTNCQNIGDFIVNFLYFEHIYSIISDIHGGYRRKKQIV